MILIAFCIEVAFDSILLFSWPFSFSWREFSLLTHRIMPLTLASGSNDCGIWTELGPKFRFLFVPRFVGIGESPAWSALMFLFIAISFLFRWRLLAIRRQRRMLAYCKKLSSNNPIPTFATTKPNLPFQILALTLSFCSFYESIVFVNVSISNVATVSMGQQYVSVAVCQSSSLWELSRWVGMISTKRWEGWGD